MADINKSARMRQYFDEHDGDVSIAEVADEIGVRYQFAYQVLRRHCRKNDLELPTSNNSGPTKKDEMIELWEEGMAIADIAKAVDTNYSYAWSTIDAYRKDNGSESGYTEEQ